VISATIATRAVPFVTRTNHERESRVGLTEREREVAKLAAEGATSRQIAEALPISMKEIKRCLDALFGKGQGEG
jgi:DNA-binding NarL/FixJ family response regulator